MLYCEELTLLSKELASIVVTRICLAMWWTFGKFSSGLWASSDCKIIISTRLLVGHFILSIFPLICMNIKETHYYLLHEIILFISTYYNLFRINSHIKSYFNTTLFVILHINPPHLIRCIEFNFNVNFKTIISQTCTSFVVNFHFIHGFVHFPCTSI